jgi:hypothetical protein
MVCSQYGAWLRFFTESRCSQRCTVVLMPSCAGSSISVAEDCGIYTRAAGVVVAFL